MSLAIVQSRACVGIHAPNVTIEVHISQGLPAFMLVGLAETTVKEARDRVRSAIINANFQFPSRRLVPFSRCGVQRPFHFLIWEHVEGSA